MVNTQQEAVKKKLLQTYFEDIINKDIIQRYQIRKIDELITLARFLLTNISNTTSYNSLEKKINISNDTIQIFTSYLEDVQLIKIVKKDSLAFHPYCIEPLSRNSNRASLH